MESSTILTADLLDILFEGRNKEYGAYELRRSYRRRLALSITVMLSVVCMLFIGFAFAGRKTQLAKEFILPPDTHLVEPPPPKEKEVLPPPPPKPPAPPVQMKMAQFTPPTIVRDDLVPKDEMPPVEQLDDVRIGNMTVKDGVGDNGTVVAPPGDPNGTVIEAPQKEDAETDKIFTKVEIESLYPGGLKAWQRFLERNLRFPQQAIEAGASGTVIVQFIVDKDGTVSNVEAISGPEELRAEAVRVIKKSGKWTAAIQNGNPVKSYKKQPISFQLNTEE